MPMTLNQLRYFCELADAGNFGRAAERLHMTQPPLSRQIAGLETELGTKLFERGPKGVTLTAAGRQLLIDAREVLRLAALAQRNVVAARRGETGQLSLGFTMCAAYSVVPALTRRYKVAFPNVEFRVREMMPVVLERALREGEIDLGISFPGLDGPDTMSRPLLREPMSVVLPFNHKLSRVRRLKVRTLSTESFLIVPRDQAPSLHDGVVQRCQSAGFTPKIGLEVYLQQTIVNLVAAGLGVAFVPGSMQKAQVKGAVFKTVDNPPMVDQLLVWQSMNTNPCIQGFLSVCAELT
ncbi:LysR family transcriptional regulator [Bradyrhizobium sp. Tv2a-2]|uniref:LysR family transcriptional regulator n=1 Tax=Bradyrhizobium sp. Tv2a-2 TaxID=113395 RepID=UPI00042A31DC